MPESHAVPGSEHGPHHLTVEGMTCAHCVRAVGKAASGVAGIREVSVDLAAGRLTWCGHGDASAVRRAIEREGYIVSAGTRSQVSQ